MPPGRIKIVRALEVLAGEEKEFSAITTAEIAKTAGVTEALIYKYFKDKRDLLHQILSEYLEQYRTQMGQDLKGIKGHPQQTSQADLVPHQCLRHQQGFC